MRPLGGLLLAIATGALGCATASLDLTVPGGEPRPTSRGTVAQDVEDAPQAGARRSGSLRASAYLRRPLRGFDVRVAPALIEGDQVEVGDRALDALDRDLGDVLDQTPSGRHPFLRSVPIFLGVADPVAPCACYHPSARWLERNGYDPAKAKSVEISNARTFVEWRRRQPSVVLHELAHALLDQVLRPEQPRLLAALEAIRTEGTYDTTLRWSGAVDQHYALSNVDEYFAETTESLLGVNDFYPFVRAELLSADPGGAALVAALWKDEPERALVGDAEDAAAGALERLGAALEVEPREPSSESGGRRAALEPLLSPDFKLVDSNGRVTDREALIRAPGEFSGRPARPVEVLAIRNLGPLHATVVYRGEGAGEETTCWALLQRSQRAPGGLRWLRLEASGPAAR